MENVSIFYIHFDFLNAVSYVFCGHLEILWPFGTFFPVLVSCAKKDLATPAAAPPPRHSLCTYARVIYLMSFNPIRLMEFSFLLFQF
jgi:hypothetical protein